MYINVFIMKKMRPILELEHIDLSRNSDKSLTDVSNTWELHYSQNPHVPASDVVLSSCKGIGTFMSKLLYPNQHIHCVPFYKGPLVQLKEELCSHAGSPLRYSDT